jgi:hypothetical protein
MVRDSELPGFGGVEGPIRYAAIRIVLARAHLSDLN